MGPPVVAPTPPPTKAPTNPPTKAPTDPPTKNPTTIINTGVNPEGMLQLCEGDCDRDSDCGEGLKCFQREDNEDIPGCIGDPLSKWDYCIPEGVTNPPVVAPTPPPVVAPTPPPTKAPTNPPTKAPTDPPTKNPTTIIYTGVNPEGMLQLCEGDCDRD